MNSTPKAGGITFGSVLAAPGAGLEASMVSARSSKYSSGRSFMRDLDKLNELQTAMSTKITKEKRRKLNIDKGIAVILFHWIKKVFF